MLIYNRVKRINVLFKEKKAAEKIEKAEKAAQKKAKKKGKKRKNSQEGQTQETVSHHYSLRHRYKIAQYLDD